MIVVAKLEKPYTDAERISFIVNYNHQLGYQINETENELQALGFDDDERKEQKISEVRAIRDNYLKIYVDDRAKSPFMWDEIPEEEKALIGEYRKYLLDYTKQENWYEHNPLMFEEWKESQTPITEEPHVPTMGEVYGAV